MANWGRAGTTAPLGAHPTERRRSTGGVGGVGSGAWVRPLRLWRVRALVPFCVHFRWRFTTAPFGAPPTETTGALVPCGHLGQVRRA